MVNDGGNGIQAGDTITYSFTVTNTGNVALSNITVMDPKVTVNGGPISLAPGASDNSSFTATYTITAADIAAGKVDNQATVSGTDPDGTTVTDDSDDPTDPANVDPNNDGNPDDPTSTPLATQPPVAVDDNTTGTVGAPATLNTLANDSDVNGDMNASSVSITTPGATDTDGDGDNDQLVVPGEGTWSVDNTTGDITFTPEAGFTSDPTPITYTVSDAAGNVSNAATETIDYAQNPSISVEKSGTFMDENGDGFVNVGETIHYDFNVTNIGNVPLSNVTLSDNNAVVSGGPITILLPGESNVTAFSGTHTITLQDIIDGVVVNQATVSGTDPDGNSVTDISDDPTDPFNADPDGDGEPDDNTTTALPIKPPSATDNIVSVGSGNGSVTLDVVADDQNGTFPLDRTTVSLTVPAGATNIVTDADGDIVGFDVPGEGTWSVDTTTGAVTFSPNAGYVGDPTPIDYSVDDTQGNTATATIAINYPPVANPDVNNSLLLGQTAVLNPLANDQQTSLALDPTTVSLVVPAGATNIVTDADGDIVGFDVPGEGTWSVDTTTGEVTFVPDAALAGDPTPVLYTVKETGGDISNQAELRVSYVNAAIFPVAVDDTLVVNHYGGNSGTVVNNDQLGTGTQSQHTWSLVTPPQHGRVEFNSDGTYTYYPDANYNGPDSFVYMITDAAARTSTATVTINVDCASTQTSDGGDALGWIGILIMMFMTMMTGLYFVRKEEKGNES